MLHSEVALGRCKTFLQLQNMVDHYQAEWGVVYDAIRSSRRDPRRAQRLERALELLNQKIDDLRLLMGAEMAISRRDEQEEATAPLA